MANYFGIRIYRLFLGVYPLDGVGWWGIYRNILR